MSCSNIYDDRIPLCECKFATIRRPLKSYAANGYHVEHVPRSNVPNDSFAVVPVSASQLATIR